MKIFALLAAGVALQLATPAHSSCLEAYEKAAENNSDNTWFDQQYQYRGYGNVIINAINTAVAEIERMIAERQVAALINRRLNNAKTQKIVSDIISGNQSEVKINDLYSSLQDNLVKPLFISKNKFKQAILKMSQHDQSFCRSITETEELLIDLDFPSIPEKLYNTGNVAGLLSFGDYADAKQRPIATTELRVLSSSELLSRIKTYAK